MKEVIQLLKKDFEKKCQVSPGYSMRLYAIHLGISKSSLSNILNGDGILTPKIFEKISPKLNLSPYENELYLSKLKKIKKQKDIRNLNEDESLKLQMEEFNFIADWYHFAILYMCDTQGFKSSPKWVAKRLGLSDVELVETAISRLISLKLLKRDEKGELTRINQFTSILDYNSSSVAMRTRQKQLMKISSEKIDLISINKRDNSSMTISVDSKLLPEIKERIKTFRRTLSNYIIKHNEAVDQVYELQIAFFPLLEQVKE